MTQQQRRPGQWWVLAASIGLVALVAYLGTLATIPNTDGWYASAETPPWTPPEWLFGPVWSILYLAMAIAAWRIWRTPSSRARTTALTLYLVQLLLNGIWSPLFFAGYPLWGTAALWAASVVIIVLAGVIVATIAAFHRVDRPAAYILIPYLVWVLYATSLNIGVAALAA
ncbi:MAG TPA: tryptophan-rich sensory protein [Terrimesophilobacter sp.]|nr:tryptophan-rich sensory protein [Terrimesophilobacter sp.]